MTPADPDDKNRQTVAAYDAYAERYDEVTQDGRTETGGEALDLFLARVKPAGRILEVASGPGWDADTMEARGFSVRRTDVSDGFIAVQAKRGRHVEKLDLISDELDGPYDGLVALYMIQHIPRDVVDSAIARMAEALAPGGVLLFSFQLGDGDRVDHGTSGDYHIVMWAREEMDALLARSGFTVVWERVDDDTEGRWVSLVALRESGE